MALEEIITTAAKDGSIELDLDYNQLTTLPESIAKLQNLELLNLDHNQLIILPESIAKLQNLQTLFLSSNQLTTLPEGITKLQNLQMLTLDHNQLTTLPESITKLQYLHALGLSGNQLKTLPESIGKLQNLQTLDLTKNQLTTLPEGIDKLQNLQMLFLRGNQLATLPESIGKLQNLQTLDLTRNQLTTLPESITKLQNLQALFLNHNQLTTLPESICKIQNLNMLDLENNQLTTLPESMAKLQNLRSLSVFRNQLTTLSESIGKLQNLRMLNLDHNQLIILPESISKLQNLQTLYLSNNELIKLPESIGKLQNLKRLYLCNNKITHLPRQLFDLNLELIMDSGSTDDGLNLGGNPLESPPLEIAQQGLEAVRDYFKPLEGDPVQLFEAKLLIVGQGGVGKTFLLNRLIHNQTPETEITEGIDIHQWPLKTTQTNSFQANFWDFGGQAIYHATHQFFLTKRSLYLFVWEARKDEDISSFDYWLNTIKVLSGDSPVLVIQNKIEERRKSLDQAYWRNLFENIVEYHDVSAIEGTGTPALKDAIIREIEKLPHIGDELPKKWVDIRKDLEAIEANYIPYARYQEICNQYGMEDVQIDRLSQYYHDLGVFLRFAESPILRDTVFLKPEWATNAVYKVLDNKKVQTNFGRFCFADLPEIWQDKGLNPPS